MSSQPPQETNHPDYAIDGDAVIRRSYGQPLWTKDGKPLPIERPHAFRCIAGRWFTDGVHVIVQGQLGSAIVRQYYYRIEDADLDTFEVLNQHPSASPHPARRRTRFAATTRRRCATRPRRAINAPRDEPASGPRGVFAPPAACRHTPSARCASCAICSGVRPAPCSICSRQLKPLVTTIASSFACRTSGSSLPSPIFIDRS